MTGDERLTVEQQARVTMILAAAMATSVPVYAVVAWLVTAGMTAPMVEPGVLRTLLIALALVSAAELVFAGVLFRTQVAAARSRETVEERLGAYRVAVVITFALRESVAIYGLVLSLVGDDPVWAAAFAAGALATMLLGWPRRSEMEALAADVPPIDPP
jgi:F0F1-type ATP synthase membrane subunit c/vacuolar-type H+-ATPase subunit K